MNIMAVAQRERLPSLTNALAKRYPDDMIIPLDDGMSAVQFAFNNPVDMMYAEIQTPPITGLDVARLVRKQRPGVAVCLIADTADYASDAAKQGCTGYYLTPVSVETLQKNNLLAGETAANHDEVDLEELYRVYFPKVYNFFFYKLLHRQDAEDLTEQAFLKIAENLHTYDPQKAKIGTWIRRISENTLIDFYRTRKRTLPLEEADTLCVAFEEQYRQIINPARKELYAALCKLPERDRMLVYHKYLLGESYHEIAQKFHIKESTLASVLQRAKAKLCKELDR